MKFIFYLCVSLFLSALTGLKGINPLHSLNWKFTLFSYGDISLKTNNKRKKPSLPIITAQTQKFKKSPAFSNRSLSSTHIQKKINKYQQALSQLCAQTEKANPKESLLSFIKTITGLRQFIREQAQGSISSTLSRVENCINEEALPTTAILKEPGSFREKASTLKYFFEIYYRQHYGIQESQSISEAFLRTNVSQSYRIQEASETLPKTIMEALDCISTPELI